MKNPELLLGVHLSISGGFKRLFSEAERLKINAFQFFLGAPVVWKGYELKNEDMEIFAEKSGRYKFITGHAPYLVNLASNSPELRQRSINRVIADMKELIKIKVSNYVIHLGSNEDRQNGIYNIRNSLKEILSETDNVKILLENSSGEKNHLGGNMEEIKEIASGFDNRIGLCLDTCHLFAGGVDLRISDEVDKFYSSLANSGLSERIVLIHANDSKYPLNSRRDRHFHIGKGEIGIEGFGHLLSHPFFSRLPYILETPKQDNWDELNLGMIRKIAFIPKRL